MDLWTRLWGRYHVPQYIFLVSDSSHGCGIIKRNLSKSAFSDGLPAYLIRRLQAVQNALAQLIHRLRRLDHISDALVSLHWLRVSERIEYKIAVLVYKILQLHGLAPRYLGPLTRVADVPGRRALRSAGTNRLHIPPVRLSTVGTRAFSVAGPSVWNNLPEDITSAEGLTEIAGLDNDGRLRRGGHCRTEHWRTTSQGWTLQDWTLTDWTLTDWTMEDRTLTDWTLQDWTMTDGTMTDGYRRLLLA